MSNPMNRREFLACATALAGCGGPATPARKPNIVLIVADDLGYGDVCGYSCRGLSTPHIDSIARNGVQFTNGHVTAPVCSPSRAGFIAGRYQQRFGHEFNAGGAVRCEKKGLGLPTSETTIADALRASGYATGMIGKSHLGSQPQFHPTRRGFDEFYGFLHGANLYIEPLEGPGIHYIGASSENFREKRSPHHGIYRGDQVVPEEDYLTDAFSREAADYITRHKDEPFFLYVPYNAPHTPLQVTAEYYERFPHIRDEKQRIYAAMVSALDDGVGRILETLEQNELSEDTLVLFFSDNGCATYTQACFNDPLLGGKLTLFEGGQRVPFVAQYPGHIQPGSVCEHAVSSLDVFPTAVNLAGGALPANLDGADLMPYLTGQASGAPHEALFWRSGTNSAVLAGRHKLVNLGEGKTTLLYDLAEDIGERNDLSAKMPEKTKALTEMLEGWQSELVEPLWPSRRVIPIRQGDIEFDLFV